MSRKRSRKSTTVEKKKEIKSTPKKKINKKMITAISLVGIFFLVLFLNSYFNFTSGTPFNPDGETIGTRFFLSGPDPYYNMRLCTETMESGYYRFVTEEDMLLNYPVGHYGSARPPLFNMVAIFSTKVLENFMPTVDALGMSMLFLPAIYGALLVLPVYGIGATLFNRKTGLLAAFFVALIPIHLGSGHGSSLSLFDHDSFILLLATCVFFFMIKSLKEKDTKTSLIYAVGAGLFIGAIEMTWVASQVVYLMIAVFFVVNFFIDVLKGQYNLKNTYAVVTAIGVAFLLAFPYAYVKQSVVNYLFFTFLFSVAVMVIHLILRRIKLPWIITVPGLFTLTGIAFGGLFYINRVIGKTAGALYSISSVIFGEGIYGSQVSLTIGEAHTFGLSQTVMSFGPAVYWIGLSGFVFFLFKMHKEKWKAHHIFVVVLFVMYFWLTTTAGRFINDLIPLMALFTAYCTWIVVDKIDFSQMVKNVKGIGGLRGIRKGVKPVHILGIVFVVVILIIPNTYLALDAAVPPEMDSEVFGDGFQGFFGNALGYQLYWAEACYWLLQQDTEIELPEDRPGVISWWDYGFYIASMSEHPTVADNFQEGLRTAGNFHTAENEQEGIAVLIVRLLESQKTPKRVAKGELPNSIKNVINTHLHNASVDFIQIVEDPVQFAPSYDSLIKPEYGNTEVKVDDINAMYHDATDIIMANLTEDETIEFYMSIMDATGKQIRYYGIDGRDLTSIFGVFPFLSDKGTHGFVTTEDDYYVTLYVDRDTGQTYTLEQINNMSSSVLREMDIGTQTDRKPAFFETMIYKSYYGYSPGDGSLPENRVPGYLLKYWYPHFVSQAVTILKFYEGAKVTGTVDVDGTAYDGTVVYVLDEYQIPHDYGIVENGQFEVLVPEGTSVLNLYIGNTFLEKEITIENVSYSDATRKTFTDRTVEFHVDKASVNVTLPTFNETVNLSVVSMTHQLTAFSGVVESSFYRFENLVPDTYQFVVTNETESVLYSDYHFLNPGNNTVEVTL